MTVVANSSQRFQVLNRDEYVQAGTSCSERTFIASVESCAAYTVTATESTTADVPTQDGESTTTTVVPLTEKTDSVTQPSKTTTVDNTETERVEGSLHNISWVYVVIAVAVIFAIVVAILVAGWTATTLRLRQRVSKSRMSGKL